MDIRMQQSYFLTLLAEIYLLGRQIENGLAALDEAMGMVEATGECYYEPEIHRLRGVCLQGQGQSEEAVTAYQQAIATARTQGSKSLELRAAIDLSRFWQTQGKGDQAHQLLAPIYAELGEGFDTADLQEAQALLVAFAHR
jgi:adenylate cyclase